MPLGDPPRAFHRPSATRRVNEFGARPASSMMRRSTHPRPVSARPIRSGRTSYEADVSTAFIDHRPLTVDLAMAQAECDLLLSRVHPVDNPIRTQTSLETSGPPSTAVLLQHYLPSAVGQAPHEEIKREPAPPPKTCSCEEFKADARRWQADYEDLLDAHRALLDRREELPIELTEEMQRLQQEAALLTRDLRASKAEGNTLQSQLEYERQQKKRFQQSFRDAADRGKKLQAELDELLKLPRDSAVASNAVIDALKSQMQALAKRRIADIDALEAQLQAMTNERDILRQELDNAKPVETSTDQSDLDSLRTQLADMTKKRDELAAERERCESTIVDLKEKVASNEATLRSQTREIEKQKVQNQNLEDMCAEAEARHKNLEETLCRGIGVLHTCHEASREAHRCDMQAATDVLSSEVQKAARDASVVQLQHSKKLCQDAEEVARIYTEKTEVAWKTTPKTLTVTVQRAENLPNKDSGMFDHSDPYAIVNVRDSADDRPVARTLKGQLHSAGDDLDPEWNKTDCFKTKTIMDTGDPEWNETFDFLRPTPDDDVLYVTMWDADEMGQDNSLGQVCINVRDVMAAPGGVLEQSYRTDKSQGSVFLKMVFHEDKTKAERTQKKAEDLAYEAERAQVVYEQVTEDNEAATRAHHTATQAAQRSKQAAERAGHAADEAQSQWERLRDGTEPVRAALA